MLVVVAVWMLRPQARLAYEVAAGSGVHDGFVAPVGSQSAELAFSEGSRIVIAAESRARITRVDAQGASLVLEDGHAHLDIVPNSSARWIIHAGPHRITVTGTIFDVRWQAPRLTVAMQRGSVRLQGPLAPAGVTLTAGQRAIVTANELKIDHTKPTIKAMQQQPTTSGTATPKPTAAAVPAASVAIGRSAATTTSQRRNKRTASAKSWATLVAEGRSAAVVAMARRRGIDNVLANASAADLDALADAARYSGATAIAKRALRSVRQRFAGTQSAATAAFLLGRMAESEGDMTAALAWYQRCLRGTLSSEALGRKMVVEKRLGHSSAQATAKQYLRHFPKGSHARLATQILDQ